MKLKSIVTAFLAIAVSLSVMAQQEPLVFENQAQQDRFDKLTKELRCLVCQNQNLADSDAQLAHDLRREVHELLLSGRNDDEIKQFLVDRYGDFVLYRPPVQTNTYLLWIAPLILLLIGAWILRASIGKRSEMLANQDQTDTTD
ncbi:MAG: cytochrome c-type biogenesis protein CcmH [Xanthomonadales bacterium]|nr:cytochrome c-type biogenesis protein CcmH [Xanthomonadales bacterium]